MLANTELGLRVGRSISHATLPLLQPASAQEIPHGLDSSATNTKYAIVEHKSKIAITRSDVYFFSNFQVDSWVESDRGVFGGKTDDSAAWVVSEDW